MLGNRRHLSATTVLLFGWLLISIAPAHAQLGRRIEWHSATLNPLPSLKNRITLVQWNNRTSTYNDGRYNDIAKRPLIAVDWQSELPSAAQEAVKNGILAAKQQEWQIAIEKFQHARQLAPKAPEIYGYLGLVESKVPGRELRAVAWFGAYLAAIRHPDNEAAVKEEIATLQIKSEANIDRILKAAENAAHQIPTKKDSYINVSGKKISLHDGASDRKGGLARVAKIYARTGNDKEAMRIITASNIDLNTTINYGVVGWLIEYGGEDGIAGARTLLARAEKFLQKNYASSIHGMIAEKEAENGYIDAAWQDANAISDVVGTSTAGNKINVLIAIARAQYKAGKRADSWKTLLQAKDYSLKMKPEERTGIYSSLTSAQAEVEDIGSAKDTLGLIPESFGYKNYNRLAVGAAQVKAGDLEGANKTATSISEKSIKSQLQAKIEQAGKATLANFNQNSAPVEVRDWLNKFNNNNYDNCPLDAAPFADLPAYLRSLPTGAPARTSEALNEAAAKIYVAHEVVAKLLKRQFKQVAEP